MCFKLSNVLLLAALDISVGILKRQDPADNVFWGKTESETIKQIYMSPVVLKSFADLKRTNDVTQRQDQKL